MNELQLSEQAVQQAGAHLDQFATSLSESERAALRLLLASVDSDAALAALAATPAEEVLDPREAALYARLEAEPAPFERALSPLLTLVMKGTRLCNLRCVYCHSWKSGPNQTMTFPVLARAIRDALRDPGVRQVDFVWHGGESTLLPIAFYRKALWLQQQFRRPEQRVSNQIQTNGTRLTPPWLAFLLRYAFSVGVSLDGPPEIHDRRRLDVGGRPTSARVQAGLAQLRAAGLHEHGVLMVIDADTIRLGARRLLDYLLEIGERQVALLNVVPENLPASDDQRGRYLPFAPYIDFLRDLFHAWYPAHAGQIAIRELSDMAGVLLGGQPQTCVLAGGCFGRYLTIEPTGQIAACDKYEWDDAYTFGNLLHAPLAAIIKDARLAAVRAENDHALDQQRDCRWFAYCRGACPHDRYTAERRTGQSVGGCCGWSPLIEEMAAALRPDLVPAAAGAAAE